MENDESCRFVLLAWCFIWHDFLVSIKKNLNWLNTDSFIVEVKWLISKTHILYVVHWFKFTDDLCLVLVLFKITMQPTFVNLLQGFTYQSLYTYKYLHDINL
jgi:hypothetical protein